MKTLFFPPMYRKHVFTAVVPLFTALLFLLLVFGTEQAASAFFYEHKKMYPLVQTLVRFITDWGNPALYLVYLGLLLYGVRSHRKEFVRFCLTWIIMQVLVCTVLVFLFKAGLGRPRPDAPSLVWQPLTLSPGWHSLPSGHTAEITGSCVALACFFRRYKASFLLGCMIALVGFSRIYLQKHYLSDVLAGSLFGLFSAYWIVRLSLLKKDGNTS